MTGVPEEELLHQLKRMADGMVEQLSRRTGPHLHDTLGELAEEVRVRRRRLGNTDEQGGQEISAVMGEHDPVGPEVSVSSRARALVTDLSHMRPLGELVDGALHGDLDSDDLTMAFKGLERRYGPYRVEEASAWYEPGWTEADGNAIPDGVIFDARIHDDNGTEAGELSYRFNRDTADGKLVAVNGLTELYEGFRGQGFSTAFSAATEDYFRRSGVDRMLVTAGLQDGGVAWAKAGYDWDPDPHNLAESVDMMRMGIDGMLAGDTGNFGPLSAGDTALLEDVRARFAGPIAGFPSPRELVMLAGDSPKLGEELMRGSYWHGMKKL